MAEQIDLLSADQATPGTMTYRVTRLDLQFSNGVIGIELTGDNGEIKEVVIADNGTTQATDLMVALNKADLTVTSLHKRVMQQVISKNLLQGAISGTPD